VTCVGVWGLGLRVEGVEGGGRRGEGVSQALLSGCPRPVTVSGD